MGGGGWRYRLKLILNDNFWNGCIVQLYDPSETLKQEIKIDNTIHLVANKYSFLLGDGPVDGIGFFRNIGDHATQKYFNNWIIKLCNDNREFVHGKQNVIIV